MASLLEPLAPLPRMRVHGSVHAQAWRYGLGLSDRQPAPCGVT
ncbi:hypothetical protein [Xanthomonas translucens]|uniref:Uncharacterized protein n=1 Tax=Xanthomonas translucens pv. translucens TaxID=134875 RepID=A0ABW9L1A2_XANCT|nr:hypothetical protein [Xanthomonas translucens]